jgi:hypothetical protein
VLRVTHFMLVRLAVLVVAWVLSMPIGAETIRFDLNRPGSLPPGWTVVLTHSGAAPKWEVRPDESAPSKPNVLAQVSSDRSHGRFPMAILDKSAVADGEISVKFKTMAGKADQVAGLVWRYRDPNNYYLVRANALEHNIAMYKVEEGKWSSLSPKGKPPKTFGVPHRIPARTWSVLKVAFKKSRFEVYFDHRKVFEAEDSTFVQQGKVGLWTKADSVTYFDDFQVSGK